MMKNPISIEILEKYINGRCTAEEVAQVKAWYFSFEHEHDYVSDLTPAEEKKLEELIYDRIVGNIEVRAQDATGTEVAEPRRKTFRIWYAAAGIAAALLVFFSIWFNTQKPLRDGNLPAEATAQELVVINNNSRQVYKAVLPDNSMVWVNPGSQLRYPKVFDTRCRAVSMSGECFFEVTKNPKQPFIISSHSIITKVWGTSFRVRDNLKSGSADVSVLTGKVSVSINEDNARQAAGLMLNKGDVMLYPHQKVIYLADQHVLKPGVADEPSMQIWTRVNLAFDNKPLTEIIPVLNAKFHVHIKAANEKLNHYILNADMTGFNLIDVLEAFKKSLNVNYEIKDNSIELE